MQEYGWRDHVLVPTLPEERRKQATTASVFFDSASSAVTLCLAVDLI